MKEGEKKDVGDHNTKRSNFKSMETSNVQVALVQLFQSHTLNCSELVPEVKNGASFVTSCFSLVVAPDFVMNGSSGESTLIFLDSLIIFESGDSTEAIESCGLISNTLAFLFLGLPTSILEDVDGDDE